MSSPVSCHSPSQSPYCPSIFSHNGNEYPYSPGYASGVSTPTSMIFKEEPTSPVMFSSPSPIYQASNHSASSAINIIPSNDSYYRSNYASVSASPVASPPHHYTYPQEYYRPQNSSAVPSSPSSLTHINTQQYPYSQHHQMPQSPTAPPVSPYSRHRRSLPPVDPTRLDDEVWVTSNGKKVRHSAMHLHCATM